jgi:hypothetical protein
MLFVFFSFLSSLPLWKLWFLIYGVEPSITRFVCFGKSRHVPLCVSLLLLPLLLLMITKYFEKEHLVFCKYVSFRVNACLYYVFIQIKR